MPQDTAYFCPQCGNPTIERSSLAGGAAACKACEWKGKSDDLHAVPFEHDFGSGEEAMARFTGEVSNIVAAKVGHDIGALLMKWGFLKPEKIAEEFPVYGRALAVAVVKALLETREGLATGRIKPHPKKPEQYRRGVH